MKLGFPIVGVALAATLTIALADKPTDTFVVRFVPGDKVVVEANGLSITPELVTETASWDAKQWQCVLSVSVDYADVARAAVVPPMIGRYTTEDGKLRFEPQFSLQPGLRYRARLDPSAWPDTTGDAVSTSYEQPKEARPPSTSVSLIYPTADQLPENLLKFYVHFSAPMSRGQIYDHISLNHANGEKVELPFLEIDEELWDPEMRRVTLFIDPGRIKRGVKPLEDIGPSLEQGEHYTLTIANTWLDATGTPLKESYQKNFAVIAPDRTALDPKTWTLTGQEAGTREPLIVTFPTPMDHAITVRSLKVIDVSGNDVLGQSDMGVAEQTWIFHPDLPWKQGDFHLAFANTIEDLAGNNVGKAFEVDVFETVTTRITAAIVKVPFTTK